MTSKPSSKAPKSAPKQWKFSDDAKAAVPAWNERWNAIALSTEPIDFDKTKAAVLGMVSAAKLETPVVVRCLSAIHGAIVCAWAAAYYGCLDAAAKKGVPVSAAGQAQDPGPLPQADQATIAAGPPCVVMGEAARASVLSCLPKSYHSLVTEVAKALLAKNYIYYNGGNEWCSWTSNLAFVRDVCGFSCKEHENFKHCEDLVIYGGPVYFHRKFILICDRPVERHVVLRNGVYTVHREDGPAIVWKCGTKEWYINGLRLDEKIVMRPQEQTLSEIENETNEDIKAVRIERFGWTKYIAETNAECLDYRSNDIEGTKEALLSTRIGKRLLVTCPTGRIFALGVPASVKTCQEAKNWMHRSGVGTGVRVIART